MYTVFQVFKSQAWNFLDNRRNPTLLMIEIRSMLILRSKWFVVYISLIFKTLCFFYIQEVSLFRCSSWLHFLTELPDPKIDIFKEFKIESTQAVSKIIGMLMYTILNLGRSEVGVRSWDVTMEACSQLVKVIVNITVKENKKNIYMSHIFSILYK